MKKYIVLSVNENQEYLFYLPLTVWAWRQLGWTPVVFASSHIDIKILDLQIPIVDNLSVNLLLDWDGYKSETIAQVSRLYAACKYDGMIMTGDIDMIPLSDYWKPEWDKITTYGRDLTDYHYPICYIAMDSSRWMKLMDIKSSDVNQHIKRDLRQQENMWGLDQDLITEKLLATVHQITHIDRGLLPNGYPVGRVDRSAWSLDHPQLIDCHLPRGMWRLDDTGVGNFARVMRLLYTVWPNENFDWFKDYVTEFRKLVP